MTFKLCCDPYFNIIWNEIYLKWQSHKLWLNLIETNKSYVTKHEWCQNWNMPFILWTSFTVFSMLSVPRGMGRKLRSHHGADEVPHLLLSSPCCHCDILRADGPASRVEHTKCTRGDAGHTETGERWNNKFTVKISIKLPWWVKLDLTQLSYITER